MLKTFRIGNFRNLINVQFQPVGCNLLIGPNNAGKTSLCSAMQFVSITSYMNLEAAAQHAVGETWNIANAYVNSRTLEFALTATLEDNGQTLSFDYTLKIAVAKSESGLGVSLRVEGERLQLTAEGFQQAILLECEKEQAKLLHEESFLQGNAFYAQTISPSDATMLSRLYDLQTNRRANLFKRYLQSWLYYNLNAYSLRLPKVMSEKPMISSDGSNLTRALFTLHNERPRTEKKIIESLRTVEPKADLFTFASPDPQSIYMFMEDKEGNRFGVQSMSDGTLRYLSMAYLVYALAEQRPPLPFAPLVMIEEPENGLYVGQLKPLFEKIDVSGANGQFVFTSHSPYFIDLFEKDLRGVHLLKPGKPSSTLVVPDAAKTAKLLEEMPLGELHFREMLS